MRNAIHCPLSSNCLRTDDSSSFANCDISKLANISSPPSFTSMLTDCKDRLSPRFIPETTPGLGDVKSTPLVFLSENNSWPFLTSSPTLTSIVGFIPRKSGPTTPTDLGNLASSIDSIGSPIIGKSKPFLIVINDKASSI